MLNMVDEHLNLINRFKIYVSIGIMKHKSFSLITSWKDASTRKKNPNNLQDDSTKPESWHDKET